MYHFSKEKFLMYVKHDTKSVDEKPKDLTTSYTKRDNYYAKAYDAIILEKKSVYWNWPAAFFQIYWLLYRRMYFEAFVYSLVWAILGVISIFFIQPYPSFYVISSIFSGVILFVVFGLFGTTLYVYGIKKRVENAKNIPSSSVDDMVVLLASLPIFLGGIVMGAFAISPGMEKILSLIIIFLLMALAFYKYQRARFDNII